MRALAVFPRQRPSHVELFPLEPSTWPGDGLVAPGWLPCPCISVLTVPASSRQSGLLSSLPFVAAASCTILGGQLADFLLSRNLLRLITVRKLFSSLGKDGRVGWVSRCLWPGTVREGA